jgi:hypothetical protein
MADATTEPYSKLSDLEQHQHLIYADWSLAGFSFKNNSEFLAGGGGVTVAYFCSLSFHQYIDPGTRALSTQQLDKNQEGDQELPTLPILLSHTAGMR